jgi:alpha-tubulin suppressor-like RCC1 family protein
MNSMTVTVTVIVRVRCGARRAGSAAAVDVSTGDSHAAVVCADGTVVTWGTFRTSSGLWAFNPTTTIAKTPVVCYTPESIEGGAEDLGLRV